MNENNVNHEGNNIIGFHEEVGAVFKDAWGSIEDAGPIELFLMGMVCSLPLALLGIFSDVFASTLSSSWLEGNLLSLHVLLACSYAAGLSLTWIFRVFRLPKDRPVFFLGAEISAYAMTAYFIGIDSMLVNSHLWFTLMLGTVVIFAFSLMRKPDYL